MIRLRENVLCSEFLRGERADLYSMVPNAAKHAAAPDLLRVHELTGVFAGKAFMLLHKQVREIDLMECYNCAI